MLWSFIFIWKSRSFSKCKNEKLIWWHKTSAWQISSISTYTELSFCDLLSVMIYGLPTLLLMLQRKKGKKRIMNFKFNIKQGQDDLLVFISDLFHTSSKVLNDYYRLISSLQMKRVDREPKTKYGDCEPT